jgi:hypothetical protein
VRERVATGGRASLAFIAATMTTRTETGSAPPAKLSPPHHLLRRFTER